jgi:hypothetical protein
MVKGVDEILRKYGGKLEEQVKSDNTNVQEFSRDYLRFKQSLMPELTRYERWCHSVGSMISLKLAKKDSDRIQKQLDAAHLDVTPSQTVTFALISMFAVFFVGLLLFILYYFISGNLSFVLIFLAIIFSLFVFYYLYTTPSRMANKFRLQVSSQMVPCILYVVAYMKHTSNLERAIAFAATYLPPPISLDLKKVFWDVETGKYSTIKESLDAYLAGWKDTNIEFVESFHLVESSLYEPSEERRVQVLERALQVILDGVYEKMLKFTRDVRSPLTNIYMLGVVLPTLGIALLPLASTLLGGAFRTIHVFVIFNLLIPFFVYYLTTEILLKRPGGYGESELLEMNPDYPKFISKKPYKKALWIAIPLILLGLLPFLFQWAAFTNLFHLQSDYTFRQIGLGFIGGDDKIFGFKQLDAGITGPFGLGALLLSLFIPLGIALLFAMAYREKTKDLIRAREDTRNLEDEFISSLFQLGNRLGDGTPAELAFAHVAESTRGTKTENFFRIVNSNIQSLGMSLEQAIFNPKRGAIVYYPSELIATSMKILIESVKKGLKIAAVSLISISEYVKNIHKINERLHDLLAEVVSDMKSNMTFLAPLLAGIVVGLASMISLILGKLQYLFEIGNVSGGGAAAGLGNIGEIMSIFDVSAMIPAYFLQLSIGIYIIEIIFILSRTLVTVDSGADELRTVYETGINLKRGVYLYLIVALVATIALSLLGSIALGGLTG